MTALAPPLVVSDAHCGALGVRADACCACVAGGQLVLGHADGTLHVYGAAPGGESGALVLLRVLRCAGGRAPSSIAWLPAIGGLLVVQPCPPLVTDGGVGAARTGVRVPNGAVVYPNCLVALSRGDARGGAGRRFETASLDGVPSADCVSSAVSSAPSPSPATLQVRPQLIPRCFSKVHFSLRRNFLSRTFLGLSHTTTTATAFS